MWWFFAANKTNQVLLEHGGISLDFSNDNVRNAFIDALSSNHGVNKNDISLYYVSDKSSDVVRMRKGDSWSLTWSGSAPSGEINGISFAIEDSKKWLQFSSDKSEVLANNKDTVTISVTILNADKQSVDTTFSGNMDIPISIPEGVTKARFAFYAGRASKSFKFSTAGTLMIGSRMSTYRISNPLSIDILI